VAVVAVCSAKGSPGVTTTALLLAALWPVPVLLVDADPAGGDIALRLPGQHGRPLDAERGLLTLLPLARRGLVPDVLFSHAQLIAGGTAVIAGLGGPEQAAAVGALWDTLARAFAESPVDVIVDAGRTHSQSVHLPVLRRADVVVSILRPTVAAVVHTREQLRGLGPQLRRPDGSAPRLVTLVVHDTRRPEEVADAAGAIGAELPSVGHLGHLALDPVGAGIFEGRPRSHPERTMLVRSGRAIVSALVPSLPQPAPALPEPVHREPPPARAPQPARPRPEPPAPQPVREQVRQPTGPGRPLARRRAVESYAPDVDVPPEIAGFEPPPPQYANGRGRHGTERDGMPR
jgi:MinD-like ATPase involved in chromosome partitioning or flagellar assembly